MKHLLVACVVALIAAVPCLSQEELPTAETLVESVASTWDPVQVRLLARMTVLQPGRPEVETELLIRRAGSGRTRVDFLAPEKDKGKALLQVGSETWLFLPRTGRVIEVPAKRSPLAGGVLFEDLFPGGESETAGATVEATDEAFVLTTQTVRSGGRKRRSGTSKIYFDRSTLLPMRREVYASSGRLLKTVRIEKLGDWNGVKIPWAIHFEDHLRKGGQARIEVVEATALTPEEEQLVSHERLGEQ